MTESNEDDDRLDCPRTGAGRGGGARNHHPTLKPIALTSWLASLIKPPTEGACLLVPYSGAGSEMIGALQAGWPIVFGIEGNAEYVEIAHARIAAHTKKRDAA
jgi:site-specific DNA-methyltransferase (adenine-specific)